jgi:hypothetical protein
MALPGALAGLSLFEVCGWSSGDRREFWVSSNHYEMTDVTTLRLIAKKQTEERTQGRSARQILPH